ncbi:Amino acid permease [Nesidiocoris tenuis]|uniref:Amino acid permease n=1 Tax=Nesidiocoris tenuis TaxID=355587 RepID=A0ABN7B689_9HEMI|nr:Amino acid permease [Nesidiocoris tenuis]
MSGALKFGPRGGTRRELTGYDNPSLTLSVEGLYQENRPANEPRKQRPSFSTLTQEALPRIDSYTNTKKFFVKRPSISDFHNEPQIKTDIDEKLDKNRSSNVEPTGHGIKLGWIQGVLIPCLLNIWGVMLFLRLSWVVGESGILYTLVIITISYVVCVITTLSLSAISTNGEVKGGGIYYIISRSLGPEFGASVGLILAFANAVAASMNTIGFCDSLNDLLKEHGLKIIDGATNDVRVVGVIAILIMIVICAVGMEWESKAQNFLVVIILAAIFNFLVGAIMGPQDDLAKAKGFEGMSWKLFKGNWNARDDFTVNDFFTVFAIFFPSVTGIQAGANISGDLKDPASSIPKGTLLSLLISMISYISFVIFAGSAALRNASGNITQYNDGTFTDCQDCKYGLVNDYTIMQLMSGWALLIYFGCWAATLSTALTNLLSVPRLIQALGIDHIYPGLIFFSKGYGKAGEPYRGYVLTFLISSAFVIIAELNAIAPLISNFYLASYALINFCTFHAALIRPLGWRPTFKYYNIWLSLLGAVLCVIIMFLINWIMSLVTFVVFFILYIVVVYRNPDANWGSSTQAQTYKTALMTAQKLASSSEHVKNYQPQLLVLSGQPQDRPALVDLANLITKNNSLMLCAEICQARMFYKEKILKVQKGYNWLNLKKIKGFFNVIEGLGMEEAAVSLMQASGVGKLKPNVLLMGYKSDWQKCHHKELLAYFNIMYEAFANRLAVAILRVPDGLDCSPTVVNSSNETSDVRLKDQEVVINDLGNSFSDLSGARTLEPSVLAQSSLTIAGSKDRLSERPTIIGMSPTEEPKDILFAKKRTETNKILHKFPDGEVLGQKELDRLRIFDKKYKNGRVDVWWLYDDGGLTILLPYILSTRSTFSGCEMRIFALASKKHDLKTEEENMACLLNKFRINYTSLTMINDHMDEPNKKTSAFFDDLLHEFTTDMTNGSYVSKDELAALKDRTDRQLKLRELLQRHSTDSTFVVMSLPMPRKNQVPPAVYMAWLETLTRDMPPFLLIRGNQAPVLTFYS